MYYSEEIKDKIRSLDTTNFSTYIIFRNFTCYGKSYNVIVTDRKLILPFINNYLL